MKEEKIVTQLKTLKRVQPDRRGLRLMKKHILLRVQPDVNARLGVSAGTIWKQVKAQKFMFLSSAVLVFCLIILSILYSPARMHTMFVAGRMSLAENRYDKAAIAFNDLKRRYGGKTAITQKNADEMLQTLAMTNKSMSDLRLKGESGKYTSEQCQQLYWQYLIYLKQVNSDILSSHQSDVQHLKSQLMSYQEQAERKLHSYPKL